MVGTDFNSTLCRTQRSTVRVEVAGDEMGADLDCFDARLLCCIRVFGCPWGGGAWAMIITIFTTKAMMYVSHIMVVAKIYGGQVTVLYCVYKGGIVCVKG